MKIARVTIGSLVVVGETTVRDDRILISRPCMLGTNRTPQGTQHFIERMYSDPSEELIVANPQNVLVHMLHQSNPLYGAWLEQTSNIKLANEVPRGNA